MATFTVNTTADVVDGNLNELSLREAVSLTNATAAADTIEFASTIQNQTLTLTGGELILSEDVHIGGDNRVVLSGGRLEDEFGPISGNRIFNIVGASTDVTLNDLSLFDRYGGNGGAIYHNGASLAFNYCSFDNNIGGNGGAIFAADDSILTIDHSSFNYNSASYNGSGGAVAAIGSRVTVRNSSFFGNSAGPGGEIGGAIYVASSGTLLVEDSRFLNNYSDGGGGAIGAIGAENQSGMLISRCLFLENSASYGGALNLDKATIIDCTIADNTAHYSSHYIHSGKGGGIFGSDLIIRNSTITGNRAETYDGSDTYGTGGGIAGTSRLDIANSIVAGNFADVGPDIAGAITLSNGHNVFGSPVTGDVAGDRESIAASTLFTTGTPNFDGVVVLRNSTANPALGGADVFAFMSTDQIGATRPLPGSTSPDIGAAELNRTLSTTASANNDQLSGTSSANTISGLAGNDKIFGQAGADTLNGNDGSDTFDGGIGNDKINGSTGVDTVRYDGNTAVRVDLSGSTDTAKRGSETDTLTGIEAMLGSSAADTLIGDGGRNWFRGLSGKDTQTGGGAVDTFDFNAAVDSPVGSTTRDVIADFTHLTDKIDLTGIDADTGIGRDQAFHWVGSAGLTGAEQVGFFTSGGNTIIRGSNDADAASEFEIQLTGIKTLAEVDFYL